MSKRAIRHLIQTAQNVPEYAVHVEVHFESSGPFPLSEREQGKLVACITPILRAVYLPLDGLGVPPVEIHTTFEFTEFNQDTRTHTGILRMDFMRPGIVGVPGPRAYATKITIDAVTVLVAGASAAVTSIRCEAPSITSMYEEVVSHE